MEKYLKYLKYVLVHKWHVFIECSKRKYFWLGLVHDVSKLLPSEFFPYANHFFGKKLRDETGYYKPSNTGDKDFDYAWFLHQKRNKHHWQYWIVSENGDGLICIEIPYKYVVEMVCDWEGAHKAQNSKGTVLDWYLKHKDKIKLHPESRDLVEELVTRP